MTEKRLYKLFDKETNKTIGWFIDYEDMNFLMEWYDGGKNRTSYEVYELIEVIE